jgi:hypothetical protein
MAEERDFELLDDYLTNRLNADDKAYLEKRLQQDPDLQREYTIQQSIADGLRTARKAELKAMLNAVPVPAGGASVISKLVGVGTVALIVGIGAYFYNSKDTSVHEQNTAPSVFPKDEKAVKESEPASETPQTEEPQKSVPPTPSETPTIKSAPKTTPPTQEPSRKPDVYDPTAEIEEGGDHTEETESSTGDVELPKSEIESEVVKSDKYKFHYQRTGDLVTLYGAFDKNLYTIMDFNDVLGGKRSVFLYYKNNYYMLNEDNGVKPLSPVNDPVLLKKLRESK